MILSKCAICGSKKSKFIKEQQAEGLLSNLGLKTPLNKIWVEKGSEFYNASFKKWLQDNDIVRYSTQNEGKSVVAKNLLER